MPRKVRVSRRSRAASATWAARRQNNGGNQATVRFMVRVPKSTRAMLLKIADKEYNTVSRVACRMIERGLELERP